MLRLLIKFEIVALFAITSCCFKNNIETVLNPVEHTIITYVNGDPKDTFRLSDYKNVISVSYQKLEMYNQTANSNGYFTFDSLIRASYQGEQYQLDDMNYLFSFKKKYASCPAEINSQHFVLNLIFSLNKNLTKWKYSIFTDPNILIYYLKEKEKYIFKKKYLNQLDLFSQGKINNLRYIQEIISKDFIATKYYIFEDSYGLITCFKYFENSEYMSSLTIINLSPILYHSAMIEDFNY